MIEKRGPGRPKGGSLKKEANELLPQLEEALHREANPALHEVLKTLEAAYERKQYSRLNFFEPYPKQREFFAAGAKARERLLIAGNQLGKTYAGAIEVACHLTGLYPDWWTGRRFTKAVKGWAACTTGMDVRDAAQAALCGPPGVAEGFGTGTIPKKYFIEYPSSSRGVANAHDTLQVRHVSGGISTLTFKSYEMGREKFQGATLDFVWCDEEPPMPIYAECLARIAATNGFLMTTFTPLHGWTDVVNRFLEEEADNRIKVQMTIRDVTHLGNPDEVEAGYPPHERQARVNGIPLQGRGRIFTMDEANIAIPAPEHVPQHWTKLWGIDFGIAHPFAAVLTAWDRDTDVFYILHTIRLKDSIPLQQAAAMKPIGGNVPVAWPQDGTAREKGTGESVASAYKAQELKMLPEHATWPDGGVSTEAGINEMIERMVTGRFKVASHLGDWWDEFRMYHRDEEGRIVKKKDDLLSATRIAVMAKRFGRPVLLGPAAKARRLPQIAEGVDFNVFGG